MASDISEFKLLSFDVYGTLVDWETGILSALQPMLKNTYIPREELLSTYTELEREQQQQYPCMTYSKILSTVLPKLAARLGLSSPSQDECIAFGDSVGVWPVFKDTIDALKKLSRHYKLVVLSNVDRESFAKTNTGSLQGFSFDLVITAEEIGSYKPDLRNFEYLLQSVKSHFGVDIDMVLQVAQSQYHDHHPARKLGMKSVWIERPGAIMGNLDQTFYDWKFPTLGDLANILPVN